MSLDRISLPGSELLPERIAGALRQAIVDSVLAPGERLLEQDLALRLGVSRVPLREAFRMLEGEGLVLIQPHRGAVVRERSDTELRELFSVRAMFESNAVRTLAHTRPAAALEALDTMVGQMKSAVRAKRFDEYSRLAAHFHDAMVAECGNALLSRLYDQIRTSLRRYQALMAELPESPAKSIREHEAILAAIRAGDADGASRAAELHIGELVRRFEQGPRTPQKPAPHRKA